MLKCPRCGQRADVNDHEAYWKAGRLGRKRVLRCKRCEQPILQSRLRAVAMDPLSYGQALYDMGY